MFNHQDVSDTHPMCYGSHSKNNYHFEATAASTKGCLDRVPMNPDSLEMSMAFWIMYNMVFCVQVKVLISTDEGENLEVFCIVFLSS